MATICTGCGAVMQSEQPDMPGYLPSASVQRESPLCQRCFRIRHYGEYISAKVSPEEYRQRLADISATQGLVLYVLDVLDLSGSLLPHATDIVGGLPVIAVVTKVDMLPHGTHPENLIAWVYRVLSQSGIAVAKVHFVSGRSGLGVKELIQEIEQQSPQKIYGMGMANVGKSTLLNRLMHLWHAHGEFTASPVPGTTLGLTGVEVQMSNGRRAELVDTPGLWHGRRAVDYLCGSCLRQAVPQRPMRPRVYQIGAGQSLFIGGFARLDLLEGRFQGIVLYVSNELVIHRTKLEKANEFFHSHREDLLQIPCPDCAARLGPPETYRLTTRSQRFANLSESSVLQIPPSGQDIVLSGLGWITLSGARLEGEIKVSQDIWVTTRPRLIGDLNRWPGRLPLR